MIYLHKILPLIFSPLMLVIMLVLLGAYLKSKKITLTGIVILVICSLPIISNKLISYLEINYTPQKISNISSADAIVVLSGMVNTIKTNDGYKYEFNNAVDRFISGIDLYKNNKAPYLVFTRGKYRWSVGIPEGEYLKEMAIKYGVPSDSIILTENVENTDEEAKSLKKIFNNKKTKLILVTSASHMPRAIKVFKAADLNVIAYPVDFKTKNKNFTIIDLIPSAGSFSATNYFVREIIGRTYYKLKYRN